MKRVIVFLMVAVMLGCFVPDVFADGIVKSSFTAVKAKGERRSGVGAAVGAAVAKSVRNKEKVGGLAGAATRAARAALRKREPGMAASIARAAARGINKSKEGGLLGSRRKPGVIAAVGAVTSTISNKKTTRGGFLGTIGERIGNLLGRYRKEKDIKVRIPEYNQRRKTGGLLGSGI